jgi:DNA-binding beta-propeller fold protein YncE
MSARLYALVFALLLAASSSAEFQAMGGTLLVANRSGGSISLFDLATGVEMARVPIGRAIPHEVAVSPDVGLH